MLTYLEATRLENCTHTAALWDWAAALEWCPPTYFPNDLNCVNSTIELGIVPENLFPPNHSSVTFVRGDESGIVPTIFVAVIYSVSSFVNRFNSGKLPDKEFSLIWSCDNSDNPFSDEIVPHKPLEDPIPNDNTVIKPASLQVIPAQLQWSVSGSSSLQDHSFTVESSNVGRWYQCTQSSFVIIQWSWWWLIFVAVCDAAFNRYSLHYL